MSDWRNTVYREIDYSSYWIELFQFQWQIVLAEEVGFKCSTYIQIGAPIAYLFFFATEWLLCVCDWSILCNTYGDCEGWWYWWLKLGALVLIFKLLLAEVLVSLVPRPSHRLVFDHLQYAKMEGESLVCFITLKEHISHTHSSFITWRGTFFASWTFETPALGSETTI